MGQHFKDDLKQKVLEEVIETKDYHSAAWANKVSDSTVYGWLKKAGYTPSDYNKYSKRSKPKEELFEDCESLKKKIEGLEQDLSLSIRTARFYSDKVEKILSVLEENTLI